MARERGLPGIDVDDRDAFHHEVRSVLGWDYKIRVIRLVLDSPDANLWLDNWVVNGNRLAERLSDWSIPSF